MAGPLENINVAILEHRFTREFSALFEKLGAKVYACALLEEKPVENREELQTFIRHVLGGSLDMMIFLTGVGARFLIGEAESMGAKDDFLSALGKVTIVVRGPKPVAALRQFGLRADVTPQNPTTEGVIEALQTQNLRGRRIGVQLYGTPNPQLVGALEAKGATVTPVQVYAYGAAADSAAVNEFIGRIIDGQIDVIAFTSGPQAAMLFDFAAKMGTEATLAAALQSRVAVASIGEVTTRALEARKITPQIVPEQSKMAALVQAVREHFEAKA
ncbi:MAG TPA: uroporphyrinogen-III synthase [Terriglobia bacterium]|jgi:uroporphyrinogen-III synthase